MTPSEIGKKYDKIANWWHVYHQQSQYGITQIERAIAFCAQQDSPKEHKSSACLKSSPPKALDIGCGSGGRYIHKLIDRGFDVTGIDISAKMIELATEHHPDQAFYHADISNWQTEQQYDLIIGWDSLFHLPLDSHKAVLEKICAMLAPNGVIIYSYGDASGEHISQWKNEDFYYSSIGTTANITILMQQGVTCKHLEHDQHPAPHVYLIGQKD